MPLDPTSAREYLNAFDFKTLFNEELGWNKPTTREATQFECQDTTFIRQEIAARFHTELKGVPAVGDSLKDLQAAEAVGAQPILVLTGHGADQDASDAEFVAKDFASAAAFILKTSDA